MLSVTHPWVTVGSVCSKDGEGRIISHSIFEHVTMFSLPAASRTTVIFVGIHTHTKCYVQKCVNFIPIYPLPRQLQSHCCKPTCHGALRHYTCLSTFLFRAAVETLKAIVFHLSAGSPVTVIVTFLLPTRRKGLWLIRTLGVRMHVPWN